ncbi:MAG TPA: hypothetical protein VNZ02_17690 [Steroidobacteraceae bacterium]|jgi:hypothetical protein|nr:hypothetical protein [Steroidobacteraceae bacterium]
MSPPGSAAQHTLPLSTPRVGVSVPAVANRPLVYIACTVLALVSNYLLGKDMSWDLLNYHLYSGFSAVNDRFVHDYFAAGPPSYFNPFAYVPFYAMVSAGLPALAIASVLAIAHSIILWLTFELAVCVCPSNDPHMRMTMGVWAIGLAFINPILMQQIGNTFADITTAELVLAGWLLLAGAVRTPRAARIVGAALLLGVATALKLTNAVHALAGISLVIMLPLTLQERIRRGLGYVIALGVGFAIVAAPWSYRLERMFGNPLFPLMNGLFRSPEFTTEPLRHFRFIPGTFAEALWRPFAMADPITMVHAELRAPDLRYAVLVLLMVWLLFRWLWRRLASGSIPSRRAKPDLSTRVLWALGCGLGVDWVLWLSGSGNSRYFLPMASVAAVVIVALLFRVFAGRPKVRNYVLAAIFGVQAIQLWMGTDYRWNPVPWDGQWFRIAVPEKLSTASNLYLTMGAQSHSFMAAFLPRGSGLINFSGGYALGPGGANGSRIAALINRYSPHVRVLVTGARLYEDVERREPLRSNVDAALQRFGLRVEASDCATITVYGLPPPLEATLMRSEPVVPQSRDTTYLVSCHLVPDDTDRSLRVASQQAADLVLDQLEDACPQLFQPRRPPSEPYGDGWRRLYMNTDLTAWVSHGWVKFHNSIAAEPLVYIGRESAWAKSAPPLACGRRNGHYFVHLLEAKEGP